MQVMPALLEQSAAGMQAGPAGMGIPLALYKCVFPPSPPPPPAPVPQLLPPPAYSWNLHCTSYSWMKP